jgi:hypothetical protein
MKYVGVLSQINIYADFKRAVLNAKDVVRNQNQNPSSRKLGGYQKRGYSNSNARQVQLLKKPFLKRHLEGLKPGILSSRKES